jgi:hypothetical protein
MRIIPDQLKSKNLVPFEKRPGRYKILGMTPENEVLMDRVDVDMSSEEQSYVRHYLNYADDFLKKAEKNALSEGEASSPENQSAANVAGKEEQPSATATDEARPAKRDYPARAA